MEKILTDNASEKIVIKWDGERFAIIQQTKVAGYTKGIILSPKEMLDLIEFVKFYPGTTKLKEVNDGS